MATRINRDVGQPIDLSDPHTLAEYEGFAADVPTTEGMIAAVNNPPAIPNANSVRAAHLLRPEFLFGRPVNTTLPSPDAVTPTRQFARQGLHSVDLPVPSINGGVWADVEMWSFQDANASGGNGQWPGPMIRVREGDLVHTDVQTRTQTHTIHHHGIEPTPMNDGVGHLTFEIAGGHYVYQWFAAEAGTYFYHCHRNTTLHFEMGMYGGLIIDPNVQGAPFVTGGPGQTYVGNTLVPYQAEALWVVDDIDTRWHGVDRDRAGNSINYGPGRDIVTDVAAGLQLMGPGKFGDLNNAFTLITDPENPRLHDFDPNVFAVTGVPVPVNPTARRDHPWQALIPRSVDDHRLTQMGVTVNAGAKVLVRALNAAYCHTLWRFPTQIAGQVIAADGRTFGREPWGERYSNPFTLASIGHAFKLSVARRWDVLLDTTGVAPGTYDVAVEVHASIDDHRLVTIRLPITVL